MGSSRLLWVPVLAVHAMSIVLLAMRTQAAVVRWKVFVHHALLDGTSHVVGLVAAQIVILVASRAQRVQQRAIIAHKANSAPFAVPWHAVHAVLHVRQGVYAPRAKAAAPTAFVPPVPRVSSTQLARTSANRVRQGTMHQRLAP